LVREAWDGLKSLSGASYLGLVAPRFLARLPYGEKTDPIDSFEFEEFSLQEGLKGLLWGNSAFLAGMLLAQGYAKKGDAADLSGPLAVADLPLYVFRDCDGDSVSLPCTERLMNTKAAARATEEGCIAVLAKKGAPEARLSGLNSVTRSSLAGRWSRAVPARTAAAAPRKKAGPAAAEQSQAAEPAPADAPSPAEAPPAEETGTGDPELDALLKGLETEEAEKAQDAPAGEDEMDPELARMLKELE
jgi:type VI secretion system protein ImpC